ncbi:ArsR/SmtB family transcription factor [Kitasatospora sp. NPDC054795]
MRVAVSPMREVGPSLRLRHRTRPPPGPTTRAGLPLVPSVFTGPALRTRPAPPDPLQLARPARGTGPVWGPSPPASTVELARRTGLSAPAVSQYLTALRDAGLVGAHRPGGRCCTRGRRRRRGERVLLRAPACRRPGCRCRRAAGAGRP